MLTLFVTIGKKASVQVVQNSHDQVIEMGTIVGVNVNAVTKVRH